MKRTTQLVSATVLIVLTTASISLYSQKPIFEKNGIKIFESKGSPAYSDAELKLASPYDGALLKEGKDTFHFEVKNYELGAQTPDATQKLCANSSKGQHIHFIMDNEPYVASYSPQIVYDMKPGHHVLLAFLSRSYHESIKSKKAFVLKQFNVPVEATPKGTTLHRGDYTDKLSVFTKFDESAPHLFYSRPKGEYVNEIETKRIMLDFYLVNCNLSPDGYKVRATINGNVFVLTKWEPYIIEGLKLGEQKIKLELIDKTGQLVKSPFNGVERTFTLKTNMDEVPKKK